MALEALYVVGFRLGQRGDSEKVCLSSVLQGNIETYAAFRACAAQPTQPIAVSGRFDAERR